VIIEFPRLAQEIWGPAVLTPIDPKMHIRTELRFDMVAGREEPVYLGPLPRLHRIRSFEGVLDRIFVRTYGLKLDDVFGDPDLPLRHSGERSCGGNSRDDAGGSPGAQTGNRE